MKRVGVRHSHGDPEGLAETCFPLAGEIPRGVGIADTWGSRTNGLTISRRKNIANSIAEKHPDIEIIILLMFNFKN